MRLTDRKFFIDVEHPELGTTFRYAGPFARFSRTPLAGADAGAASGRAQRDDPQR